MGVTCLDAPWLAAGVTELLWSLLTMSQSLRWQWNRWSSAAAGPQPQQRGFPFQRTSVCDTVLMGGETRTIRHSAGPRHANYSVAMSMGLAKTELEGHMADDSPMVYTIADSHYNIVTYITVRSQNRSGTSAVIIGIRTMYSKHLHKLKERVIISTIGFTRLARKPRIPTNRNPSPADHIHFTGL
jgi:hypothetical protein